MCACDQLGNRTYKINQRTKVASKYYYGVNPPPGEDYGSHSNRLMKYGVYNINVAEPENEENWILDESVWYYYDNEGNVIRIARKFERAGPGRDLTQVRSTRLVYNSAGLVEYVIGETFKELERVEWVNLAGSGTQYALTPEPMTWADARTYAQSRGGDLATMVLAEEFLWEQFKPESGTAHYWVGAQQASWGEEPDGGWSWVNWWPIGVDDWLTGQPDDGGGGLCDPIYAPQYCLNHDVAEYVVDADEDSYDDGLDDQSGTAEQYADRKRCQVGKGVRMNFLTCGMRLVAWGDGTGAACHRAGRCVSPAESASDAFDDVREGRRLGRVRAGAGRGAGSAGCAEVAGVLPDA